MWNWIPMTTYLHPYSQRHKCLFHVGDSNTSVSFIKKYFLFQIFQISNEFVHNET
jgi:hypothetical protein